MALIGLDDETIQWILPSRHFGVLDIFVNAEAGLLTLVFIRFVLREENYPWGSRQGTGVRAIERASRAREMPR